jgi:hypothetical protein
MPTTTPAGNVLLHDDHDLGAAHLAVIDDYLAPIPGHIDWVLELVHLPEGVPDLPSALYGPACGDAPVPEELVLYYPRGNRKGPSRMTVGAPRPVRTMVLIAARNKDSRSSSWNIFTAYGSQVIAPREWWDRSMCDAEDVLESVLFWRDHALCPS